MQNRRKFIVTLVRGSIFTSLTALSGVFIHRWSDAESCQQNLACGSCNVSVRCKLPEADKYRLEIARGQNNKAKNGRSGK